jgi:hypothetical protein
VHNRAGDTQKLICIGNDFINRTQMAQQLREKIDKWGYMKLKSFCTTKEMVFKLKRPFTEWKKIFASYLSHKGLIARIFREIRKLNSLKYNEMCKRTEQRFLK